MSPTKQFKGVFYRAVWKADWGHRSAITLVSANCNDSFSIVEYYNDDTAGYNDVYRKDDSGKFRTDEGRKEDVCGYDNVSEYEHHFLRGNGFRKWNVKVVEVVK